MTVSPASYSVLSGGCTAEKGAGSFGEVVLALLVVPGAGWEKPTADAGVNGYLALVSWYIVLYKQVQL